MCSVNCSVRILKVSRVTEGWFSSRIQFSQPNILISQVENCLSQKVEKLHSLYKVTKRAKSSDFIATAEQVGLI